MKRSFLKLLFFFSAILFVTLAKAQKPTDKKLTVSPKVIIGKLPNGITYYIRKNQEPKNRAELRLAVRAGSILENTNQAGLAHFTEHMSFNGTKNFKKQELVNFLEKSAAMPLTTWNYIGQDVKTFRHYGPMAQDFFAAFGKDDLGAIGCDTLINQQDFLGVSLIAIQALEKRTSEVKVDNENLKMENKKLRLKNEQLEARLQKIEAVLLKN